jgi:hypothetical protein
MRTEVCAECARLERLRGWKRTKLKELYWKEGQPSTKAMVFWEDSYRLRVIDS